MATVKKINIRLIWTRTSGHLIRRTERQQTFDQREVDLGSLKNISVPEDRTFSCSGSVNQSTQHFLLHGL